MSTIKETIEEAAGKRAALAREVIAAAQELHDEGKITADTLVRIANDAESGFPHNAQQELERILARHLMDEDALSDAQFLVPAEAVATHPLRQIIGGTAASRAATP